MWACWFWERTAATMKASLLERAAQAQRATIERRGVQALSLSIGGSTWNWSMALEWRAVKTPVCRQSFRNLSNRRACAHCINDERHQVQLLRVFCRGRA